MNMHTPLAAGLKLFRVDWAIETAASSPEEAAAFASEIQSQGSTATIFSVEDRQTGKVTTVDTALDGAKGENLIARRPEDTTFVARTLRPGREYRTREGLPVEIVSFNDPGEFPVGVRITLPDGGTAAGLRTKAGLHPASQGDHPGDVFEVNPPITKWVRVYDRKLNEAGKQVVGGKEFAAERGLNWYIFDTEEEARASLQGVRAVFSITYREGEGLG
ncbi:hypothetical protein ASG32_08275 [Methylobacterium sp. Leaf361]|uniref:hypothetical protein n=1 Tax=Methylobacterium sp. Leaf361 TaxID=1736352 RepID=UPI0006FC5AD8|nr:hypothetical protein [Methylobacterium sp. Leaf361]KQS75084.1 hypothetical protein ASG32_08275 [Methylobacterium sp. Leaf361]